MIVARLMGGLGNQLFQYAAGLSLAIHHQQGLKLDRSFLDEVQDDPNFTQRVYELDCFGINGPFASPREVARFIKPRSFIPKVSFKIKQLIDKQEYKQEKSHAFDPAFFSGNSSVYLDGYWQSEHYFKAIATELRSHLTFKAPLSSGNQSLANRIKEVNAVSLHVRRGDYVTNAHTNTHHGTCDLSYYEAAIAHIHTLVENPVFFVFSDDPQWAEKNLKLQGATFIQHNTGKNSYIDMQLMSYCQHHIIANSSFSWWGAWLNPSIHKAVIAPQKWFNAAHLATHDLIPETWIKL